MLKLFIYLFIGSVESMAKKMATPELLKKATTNPLSALPELARIVPQMMMEDEKMMKKVSKIIQKFQNNTNEPMPTNLTDLFSKLNNS